MIEVLITLAILIILAAVSVGIYRHYFRSAFEVDPVSILLAARMAQEEYYADHGKYANKIEKLPGFNDGTNNNEYCLNEDKDLRRKFCLTVNATDNSYTLTVKNDTNDPEWEIEWKLSCNATANIGACQPVQVKGSGLLKKVF